MDSVEVTVDSGPDGEPAWSVYVQAFRPAEGGLVGAQEWHGPGFVMREMTWHRIRTAVMAMLERMVLRDALVEIACDEHEITWCETCGTSVWEPGPFD
jgi:hypothetical protein